MLTIGIVIVIIAIILFNGQKYFVKSSKFLYLLIVNQNEWR